MYLLSSEDRKLIRDFNRNIHWLKAQSLKNEKRWVKARVITTMTGWDSQKMARARKSGEVEWKRDNGIWYNPESINPVHLKITVSKGIVK